MSLGRRVSRNALAKVVGEVAARGGGLLFYFLLARWLGPAAFGRYAFAFSYATLFAVLVDLGTNVIITREIARRPGELAHFASRINGLKLASSAVFMIVLGLSLPLSAQARDAAGLILALGLLVAGTLMFESLSAVMSGLERMEVEALSKALNKLALITGAACGYAATRTLAGTVIGLLVGMALSLAVSYGLLMRLGAVAAVRWDTAWNRNLLSHSLPLVVSWVFWNLYDNQDVVVLGYMGLPVAAVGAFAAAMKVVDALRGLPVLMTGAVFPLLSTGAAQDRARFAQLAELLLKAVWSAALPIAVGVWALAPAAVRLIYGPGFEPAAEALAVAAWAVVGIFLNHALIHLLVALDLQRRTIAGAIGAALVNLAALLVLAPRFGLRGAAAALVISEAAFFTINLGLLRGHGLGIWRPLAAYAPRPVVAAALMAACLRWVVPAWPALAAGLVALAVYMGALAALRALPTPSQTRAAS